jgi:hypothetical protein
MFRTCEETLQFLIGNEIIAAEQLCSCGGTMIANAHRMVSRCSTKRCRREQTISKGTFFAHSHIPCNKIPEIAISG